MSFASVARNVLVKCVEHQKVANHVLYILSLSLNICRFASRETTLTKYILKNINIYS
jgi:hypothetical protein